MPKSQNTIHGMPFLPAQSEEYCGQLKKTRHMHTLLWKSVSNWIINIPSFDSSRGCTQSWKSDMDRQWNIQQVSAVFIPVHISLIKSCGFLRPQTLVNPVFPGICILVISKFEVRPMHLQTQCLLWAPNQANLIWKNLQFILVFKYKEVYVQLRAATRHSVFIQSLL